MLGRWTDEIKLRIAALGGADSHPLISPLGIAAAQASASVVSSFVCQPRVKGAEDVVNRTTFISLPRTAADTTQARRTTTAA